MTKSLASRVQAWFLFVRPSIALQPGMLVAVIDNDDQATCRSLLSDNPLGLADASLPSFIGPVRAAKAYLGSQIMVSGGLELW